MPPWLSLCWQRDLRLAGRRIDEVRGTRPRCQSQRQWIILEVTKTKCHKDWVTKTCRSYDDVTKTISHKD